MIPPSAAAAAPSSLVHPGRGPRGTELQCRDFQSTLRCSAMELACPVGVARKSEKVTGEKPCSARAHSIGRGGSTSRRPRVFDHDPPHRHRTRRLLVVVVVIAPIWHCRRRCRRHDLKRTRCPPGTSSRDGASLAWGNGDRKAALPNCAGCTPRPPAAAPQSAAIAAGTHAAGAGGLPEPRQRRNAADHIAVQAGRPPP